MNQNLDIIFQNPQMDVVQISGNDSTSYEALELNNINFTSQDNSVSVTADSFCKNVENDKSQSKLNEKSQF